MASESLEVAAAGLLCLIAVPLRQSFGFPHLPRAQTLADGVTLLRDVDGLRLHWSEHDQPRSAWFPDSATGRRSAIEFSRSAGQRLELIAASVRDPNGAPLYTL